MLVSWCSAEDSTARLRIFLFGSPSLRDRLRLVSPSKDRGMSLFCSIQQGGWYSEVD